MSRTTIHQNSFRSGGLDRSAEGAVSELSNPRFLPNSYYLMMQEGGPSIPKTNPGFCQSAPLSDFSHGACRPLFIVTYDSCNGRHLFNSTALFSTDARTFFTCYTHITINPERCILSKLNNSAYPGQGRRIGHPAFLLRAALPISVPTITRTGSPQTFSARSIACLGMGNDSVINLSAWECILLDDANFGRVKRYDPMERAARFLVLSTGLSHKFYFVFPAMESGPQDWILHKGLKGNCGSALHYRRISSATEIRPFLRSFCNFGRACPVHRQMGRAAFFRNTPALNAAAIIPIRLYPENYAPLENESESRLHNLRVGVAGPINLRPVFISPYPKKDEAHSSSSQFIRLLLVDFLGKGGLALKSGKYRFNHDIHVCIPGRPFFDLFTQTIYAAVPRSVPATANSNGKDSLYGSAETFAPRPGFNGLKKTAAKPLTDAVSTPTSIWTLLHNQVTGAASVFSYLTPTNQGTVATNPLNFATGGTELRLFSQQSQRIDTHYCAAVRAAGSAAGAFVRCKPVRPHFLNHQPTQPYEPPRRMGNATGTRGGFSHGPRTGVAPFLRHETQKTYAMHPRDTDQSIDEKCRELIDQMYKSHILICIEALEKLRSANMTDKNVVIRTIMCDTPVWDLSCNPAAEDFAVDFWVDRAEYVDNDSFNLYVTQAEGNVLWNIEKKGQKPGRLNVPQQRITVRTDGMNTAPFIPLSYLTSLGGKLLLMAFPNDQVEAKLSSYDDESVMIETECLLQTVFERMMQEISDDEAGCPAADQARSPYIN